METWQFVGAVALGLIGSVLCAVLLIAVAVLLANRTEQRIQMNHKAS